MRTAVKFTLFIGLFLLKNDLVLAQYTNLTGFCQDGNQSVVLGGLTSTTKVQRSYPLCTVSVFDHGTSNLSTIYSDATGTAKTNPFTSLSDGLWSFYAVPTSRYDITFSGSSSGITIPFTIYDQSPPPGTNLTILNAQNYPGADTFAKINSAIGSVNCSSGCWINDGLSLGSTETESSGSIAISGKIVKLTLNAIYSWSSAAISNGLIQISGLAASGSDVSCNGFPQNVAYEQVNIALPCGIRYLPSSGSGPIINISETSGQAINDVSIHDISLVANSNVTTPIHYSALGNGMGAMYLRNVSIANSSTSQSWSGNAVGLDCANTGASSNAQYAYFNFDTIAITGNGAGINGGTGGTTSGGIVMDPTLSGNNCGTFGPSTMANVIAEGLTGTYGIKYTAAAQIKIDHPIIHQNALQANGRGISCTNTSNNAGSLIIDPILDDNDWNANGGVVDISSTGCVGIKIFGGELSGGNQGSSHAEDHGIDFDGGTIGAVVEGTAITNMKNYGTVINAGAVGIRYCGNLFSVGNGAATEFQTWSPIPNHGCAIFSASSDDFIVLQNMTAGAAAGRWAFDSDSTGTLSIQHGSNTGCFLDTNQNFFCNRQFSTNNDFIMTHTNGGTDTPILAAAGPASNAGAYQVDSITDGSNFTIANPTGVVTGSNWFLRIANASGGALGAITFGASYKVGTFTAPANGKSRILSCHYDGSINWCTESPTDQ